MQNKLKQSDITGNNLSQNSVNVYKDSRKDIAINNDTKVLTRNNTKEEIKPKEKETVNITNVNSSSGTSTPDINLNNTSFEDDILRYVGRLF